MKMDDIGATNQHYKAISNIAMTLTLALLQAYLMLIFSGIDLVNFSMISNDVIRYVVQVFVQLVAFVVIYSAVYAAVKAVYCSRWIGSHKDIWVQGLWLHIHMKNGVRIGTVEIKQNFYTIKAEGHNICPKDKAGKLPQKKDTTWNYTLSKVADDASARDFIGCYTANELGSQTKKDGIHVLKILTPAKGHFPSQMAGCFRDTCKISEQGITNVGDHAGELFLFKLSPAMQHRLCDENGFRYDLLARLHEDEQFKDEPYIIKLQECIEKMDQDK